jgi:hypothetical protein
VTERSGVQTGGRLLRLSPEALSLLVDGKEQVLPANGIVRVEKRDALWNGMLIGALPSALVGMAAAGASCSPDCRRDVSLAMVIFGAMGAGVGALVDFAIPGYAIVAGHELAPRNARRAPPPVASLDELWQRVRQGDTIDVMTLGGQKITGTFVQVSSGAVTVRVGRGHRDIPSATVHRVTRAGNRYRSGALWGGTLLGTMGVLVSASCNGGSDSCGDALFVGTLMATSGALWGTVIGALIPKHPVVYEAGTGSALRITPMLGFDRVGVAFSAEF